MAEFRLTYKIFKWGYSLAYEIGNLWSELQAILKHIQMVKLFNHKEIRHLKEVNKCFEYDSDEWNKQVHKKHKIRTHDIIITDKETEFYIYGPSKMSKCNIC